MNKFNIHPRTKLFAGIVLFLCLFSLIQINVSQAQQPLAKHYPDNFDLDGFVLNINMSSQIINLNGYPYGMNLQTTAYGRQGEKISLLNLNNRVKVGVVLFPYTGDTKRTVQSIWILPSDYELDSRPL